MEFTKLEAGALALFIDEYGWEFPGLAGQLAVTRPVARESTGGGFFTDLVVDKNAIPIHSIDSPIDGVCVKLEGMNGRLEVLLFFKDGYANLLEGYAIEGEDTKAIDFDTAGYTELGLLWPSRKKDP